MFWLYINTYKLPQINHSRRWVISLSYNIKSCEIGSCCIWILTIFSQKINQDTRRWVIFISSNEESCVIGSFWIQLLTLYLKQIILDGEWYLYHQMENHMQSVLVRYEYLYLRTILNKIHNRWSVISLSYNIEWIMCNQYLLDTNTYVLFSNKLH